MVPTNLPDSTAYSTLTFGEPESVISRDMIFDLFQVVHNNRWYEPPISQIGLGKAYRMASHHQAAITLKRNMLLASIKPHPLFPRAEISKWTLDNLVFGNGYVEKASALSGRPLGLRRLPAAWIRVGWDSAPFWYVPPMSSHLMFEPVPYEEGEVHHLIETDPLQEIYGMPEYISALQSGLLNENATLFRRRYYLNGMHAGFILYISEENFREEDKKALVDAMKRAKGPGNFKNLLMHIPKGKKDGVQLIPISEIAAKDEFMHIKEVTRDDMLAAHRVPPQLLGIVPKNGTGFGNVIDAARTFWHLEIAPLLMRLAEINEWVGEEVIAFAEPDNIAALVPAKPSERG